VHVSYYYSQKNVIAALGDFRSQYRLKKAVAKAIARSMSDEDEKQLAGLFKQFDKNGDGTLDAVRGLCYFMPCTDV